MKEHLQDDISLQLWPNMTLQMDQKLLIQTEGFKRFWKIYAKVNLVRYADDFIITSEDRMYWNPKLCVK